MYHCWFVTVPLLDLKAQYTPIRQALLDAVTRVCDSQRFIGGPEVEGLERELCDTLGYAHAIGLSSGTDAVLAALMAMDIGPGDEVITPTYSFFATAGSAALAPTSVVDATVACNVAAATSLLARVAVRDSNEADATFGFAKSCGLSISTG